MFLDQFCAQPDLYLSACETSCAQSLGGFCALGVGYVIKIHSVLPLDFKPRYLLPPRFGSVNCKM